MLLMSGGTLSAVFGWISMGCWIVVYTPQLYENYRLQSGEGMSILFLFGWIMGDVCSISGAILGGLVPSVIWLTSYHLLSDLLLLGQIYYYRWKRSRWPIGPLYDHPSPNTSTTALASEAGYDGDYDDLDEEVALLGSLRAKGFGDSTIEEVDTLFRVIVRLMSYMILISLLGIAAWWVDEWLTGGRRETGDEKVSVVKGFIRLIPEGVFGPTNGTWGDLEWLREPIVQVLGWTSAVIFVTSNLPQIVKNLETRCEGLAPGLFVFTSFGSCTYVLSICAKSTEKDYLATNAGWLAGHGVSALLDLAVIGQIVYYRYTEKGRRRGMYSLIH